MTAEVTKSYSILITDDDRDYREALRELVEPEGYRTVLASSGEEALDILREEPIHLALFDMHMPRMTGVEAVEIVHQINAILPCILHGRGLSEKSVAHAIQLSDQKYCGVSATLRPTGMACTVL